MCTPAVFGTQQAMQARPIQNVVNQMPVGQLYKSVSGQKPSDAIKSGDIYPGLAGGMLLQQQKKSNQYSSA